MDIESVVTLVDANELNKLLLETNYEEMKWKKLVKGFRRGFDLGYDGPTNVKRTAPNVHLYVGNETILWNKVMKEVREKRFTGPFEKIPFDNYIQSPIGLVHKDSGDGA